jgi:hypothetical protein
MLAALLPALLTVLLTAEPAAQAEEVHKQDVARLLDHLERSERLFLASVAGLTPEQWQFKPAPDRWSVAETAEHIARSEGFVRGAVEGFLAAETAPELLEKSHGKEETVLKFIVDRSQKFKAPEGLATDGQARPPKEILKDFRKERSKTEKLVHKESKELWNHAGEHPAFQELDAYGWLLFLSGHTERHTLQIREIKADPGFPKRG